MNGAAEYFQDAISKIEKAVADYREGLLRIDREFDYA